MTTGIPARRGVGWVPGLLALLTAGCEPIGRPWRASTVDAGAMDTPEAATVPTDAGAELPDLVTPESDVPFIEGGVASEFRWVDPAGPAASGCDRPGEVEKIQQAWALMVHHAAGPSIPFFNCLRSQFFSPSANGFAEEIHRRIQLAMVSRIGCEERRAGRLAHDQARASETALYFGHDLLATRSAPRVAGAALHAMLHEQSYLHHGGERGEYFFSVQDQVDRCLRVTAGEQDLGELPAVQSRDRMTIESELQPYGYLRASAAPPFLVECPPGSWVAGSGTSLNQPTGGRLASYGLICQSRQGVETGRPRTGVPEAWSSCPAGQVAVGVEGHASYFYVYSTTLLCDTWENVRGRASAPLSRTTLPGRSVSYWTVRRCPLGQVVRAVSGIAATSSIHQMTVVCRDPDAPDLGNHVDLPIVGATSRHEGDRVRRRIRCGDQGVITGFFGHRSPSTRNLIRLGALCRGTAHASGALRFREEGGQPVPEHPLIGTGGVPERESPEAVPFSELPTVQNEGRCPAGMGAVGMRVRMDGADGTPQHLQALCAPLDEWMRGTVTTPTRITVAGTWEAGPLPNTDERLCPAGSFLTGMEVEQPIIEVALGINDMIERITPICRSLVPRP